MKYSGVLISNPLKIEKEIKDLKNKEISLQRKIQIAIGSGFDSSNYEEELKLVSNKLKIYNNIY